MRENGRKAGTAVAARCKACGGVVVARIRREDDGQVHVRLRCEACRAAIWHSVHPPFGGEVEGLPPFLGRERAAKEY